MMVATLELITLAPFDLFSGINVRVVPEGPAQR
jgi:hypothetical protein